MARAANQSDVAKAAGVAISTVSRALSNSRGISSELRQQIQGLARELGYEGRSVPAAETRTVRTYITANVMTGGLVTFYSALLESLRVSAREAGSISRFGWCGNRLTRPGWCGILRRRQWRRRSLSGSIHRPK